MNQIILKIPRRKQKIKIIKSEEIIRRELDKKLRDLEAKLFQKVEPELPPEPEIIEEEIVEPEPEVYVPKRTYYTEMFTISDSNQPIEINLSNIPEDTVSIDEAAHQIQAAYNKGFAEGQDTARVIYESEIQIHNEWLKRFDSIAFNLKKQFIKEQNKFENALIDLAVMIADSIISVEATKSKEVVINQVKDAIYELTDDEVFKINISPQDFDVLDAFDSELLKETADSPNLLINKSANVDLGGCTINSSAGIIDARISTQLKRIKIALREALQTKKLSDASLEDDYPEILDTILPDDKSLKNTYEERNAKS